MTKRWKKENIRNEKYYINKYNNNHKNYKNKIN